VPVIALCQHPAVRIEHAGGKIAGFAHDGGKRRPLQGLGLLLNHRDQ
jgi:hypothetical protein